MAPGFRVALLAAALVVAGCGDPLDPTADDAGGADASVGDTGPAPDASPAAFSVVVLPDTQFYAYTHPEIFQAQTRWIAANARAHQVAFVLHEGDIVDNPGDRGQWQRAAAALHLLDGTVPYVLASGNHDQDTSAGGLTTSAPLFNEFFPASRLRDLPWFKETFELDQVQNTFQILRGGNRDWVVLTLEFGPRDVVLAWAARILAQHAALPAIIVTHAYMYLDGVRYDRNLPGICGGGQCFGPHGYGLPEPVNDGEEMWQKLVSQHDNVQFVLSGHMTGNAASRLRSVRPSGSHVHQILANYQSCPVYDPRNPAGCVDGETRKPTKGGDGFLRLMRFDPDNHLVEVKTYSPYLDAWKTSANNQFVLDLEN